jgi:glutathionyl-hydroquinone reductase
VVDPHLGPEGWKFTPDYPKCTPDTINSYSYLPELYKANNSAEGCRYTVPVLYDKKVRGLIGRKIHLINII